MHHYKNFSRISGITHYAIGKDFIELKFKEKTAIYVYNYMLNVKEHIEKMKTLALNGKGLNTYISQHPEIRNYYLTRNA